MKVRIIEKIYHHSNSPSLSTPFRRKREEFWIRELGTATPYGCNDNINSMGNLTSPGYSSVNVMNLFNRSPRRRRSHGHRHYTPPVIHDLSFNGLLRFYTSPLGIHNIRTKLYSVPLSRLNTLFQECLNFHTRDFNSPEYKLNSIILDICNNRLFKPVTKHQVPPENHSFIKVKFANKGIDAINLSNILHHKKVMDTIPNYFSNQSIPIVSYTYTKPIASRIFNYKKVLQDFKFDNQNSNSQTMMDSCSCSRSNFMYGPVGHVITGDLAIVNNSKLQELLAKGPKYRQPQSINWKQNFKLLMDSVEDYARKWARLEKVEPDTLSEWVKSIRSLIKRRIGSLRIRMSTRTTNVFNEPDVTNTLSELHNKYVVVPADKASNNIVFICKKFYFDCLRLELGLCSDHGNPTYTRTTLSKKEILDNHRSVLSSFGITTLSDEQDLPSLYWIPKLHKTPYKQRYIAGSSKCSTKPLSKLLTTLLSAVKTGLQKYCDIVYSHSGINQMWILKNSKDLLSYLTSTSISRVNAIKTFDFSTLYTTIPHSKLKERLKKLIFGSFFNKNGTRRYSYLVANRNSAYFVKETTESSTKYTEVQIVQMLDFLIDNIFVECGGQIFQQTVGIPMGTNCAPLLADLFLYSYEAEFIQNLLKSGEKKLAKQFNLTFRYIDDVLSLNNSKFSDNIDLIYPNELEIKDTTESRNSASYLDLQLEFDCQGNLHTRLYDKRDDFDFAIVNFPHLTSNIPSSPAYGVYISQLIRYSRACSHYNDFLSRAKLLTTKLLRQQFLLPRLKSSFKKFYGRHHDLVDRYGLSVTSMMTDIFVI
jgi:hypothetical protein